MNRLEISHDPNDPGARRHVRDFLRSRLGPRVPNANEYICEFVRGNVTLDIGVADHDLPGEEVRPFKHRLIAGAASHCLGIDIVPWAIEELCRQGYNVRLIDALSDMDLGERFDRIVIAEVIEHVNDPVRLLKFASRHLNPNGLIYVSTPNPFYIRTWIRSARLGQFIPNLDHVSWITPTNALEISRRANLSLARYHHVQGIGKTLLRRVALSALSLLRLRDSEVASDTFIYVFSSKK